MPKKSKQSLQNVFVAGDGFVTKTELKRILNQVYVESVEPDATAHLEVFEVMELNTPIVKGRYVYSNQRDSIEELLSFLPATSNITQPPLIGELWLGFRFKKEHYYLSRLSDSNISVNYQKSGQSTPTLVDNKSNADSLADVKSRPYGNVFRPNVSVSNQLLESSLEGQTLIQGRYGNYIQLGAKEQEEFGSEKSYIKLSNHESYIDMENSLTLKSSGQYSPLIDMNYDKTVTDGMKTARYIIGRGKKEEKPYLDLEWEGPTLWANSGRVLLTASQDDIGIFAKKTVRIKGERIQIANEDGGIEIKASSLIQDTQNGKIAKLTKDLKDGDVILGPEGLKEMGQILAKQVEWNLDFLKVQVASLIPAAIPGTRAIPNPAWLTNIKAKIDNAKKLLEFNDLVFKLKWLDKSQLKTYTIDELKEAFRPVPGFSAVIDGFKSLKDLKGAVGSIEAEIDSQISSIRNSVSEQLGTTSDIFGKTSDLFFQDTTGKTLSSEEEQSMYDLRTELLTLSDEESLDQYGKSTRDLLDLIDEYESVRPFALIGGSSAKIGGKNAKKLLEEIVIGRSQENPPLPSIRSIMLNANPFEQKINQVEIEATQLEGLKSLVGSFSEIEDEQTEFK